MRKEESLQISVSNYLKHQYPKVIFTSDSSGLRLPMGLAIKAKKMRSCSGIPDMIILKPSNGYNGLCLELKAESPYKKNGELFKNDHLKEQNEVLRQLRKEGYYADFVTGIDEAKRVIDIYFKNGN